MIITSASHLDHNLTPEQINHIRARFADWNGGFFIESFELPTELGTVPCALFGPKVGDAPIGDDEATMRPRPGREYPSRLVARDPRPTRTVTVIAGPNEGEPCILYTAFGGPLAPKEPGDPTLEDAERPESEAFWSQHALAEPVGR